jgi:chromosomal replication initiation ATPase DnaA
MYKRDHTTIIYGVQKIKQSPEYEAVIEKIRQKYPELLEKKAPSDGRPVGNWRF